MTLAAGTVERPRSSDNLSIYKREHVSEVVAECQIRRQPLACDRN